MMHRHLLHAVSLACVAIFLAGLPSLAQEPRIPVTGSGTPGKIPKWTGTVSLGDSVIVESSGKIGIGTSPAQPLDVNGTINTSTQYAIGGSRALGIDSSANTAVGAGALSNNTTGFNNTAAGFNALLLNTTGFNNTALGLGALLSTTGNFNTAAGSGALSNNTTGSNNTALGLGALQGNTTGSGNIAIGLGAGNASPTGNNNIYIDNEGAAAESATIRIGRSFHARTFIAGIRDVTTGMSNALAVVIDSNGQLGTVSSSQRVKDEIRDMGEASRGLLRLRPVTFRYKQPSADGSRPLRYGLIAEEVAEVYPELVAYDATGAPVAVIEHMLPAILLNELQTQHRQLEAQAAELSVLRARLAGLEAALAASGQGTQVTSALRWGVEGALDAR